MTINGIQFNLFNYIKTSNGIKMTINNTTTEQLETAIGQSADIVISDEYRGYGMKLCSMYKKYNPISQHELEFIDSSIQRAVDQNASDIEMNAEAIMELAEMIGSNTNEWSEA